MPGLGLQLNVQRFTSLLRNLIGVTEQLQNNPPDDLVPKENLAIEFVLEVLDPYLEVNGGKISSEQLVYDENQERGNLILGYTPDGWTPDKGTISFIGSHLDVVPGKPEEWEEGRNPFEMVIEGDRYYGRGTTDCLGHVALLTDLFAQLGEQQPALNRAIWAVFIASEEYDTPGIGIDRLLQEGKLERMKNGPVYWVDTSDRNPCMGCATAITWTMRATGVSGHSGLPDKAINPIEMGDEALKYLQDKFYEQYPRTEQEELYKFQNPSTMKPTQVEYSGGSSNQIPLWTDFTGDIRLTPFYDSSICINLQKAHIAYLNRNITILPTRGPVSKYEIIDPDSGETLKGELEIELSEPMNGIACDLTSRTFQFLHEATKEIVGKSEPFSLTGSLPLVGDMQAAGFDIMLVGYGRDVVYHKPNEYCNLSYMRQGMEIISLVIDKFENSDAALARMEKPAPKEKLRVPR